MKQQNTTNNKFVNNNVANQNSVRDQLMMNNAVMDIANNKSINTYMKKQIEKNEKEKKALRDENIALKNRYWKSTCIIVTKKRHLKEDIEMIYKDNNNTFNLSLFQSLDHMMCHY